MEHPLLVAYPASLEYPEALAFPPDLAGNSNDKLQPQILEPLRSARFNLGLEAQFGYDLDFASDQ